MYEFFNQLLGATKSYNPQILEELFKAHAKAAVANQNISMMCAVNAWRGSGSECAGICAGLSSIGGTHAPVVQARQKLFTDNHSPSITVRLALNEKRRLPGFGHAFYKSIIDPVFMDVAKLTNNCSKEMPRLVEIETELAMQSGSYYPINAAGITACVAEIMGIPSPMELALFIIPRTTVWLSLMK